MKLRCSDCGQMVDDSETVEVGRTDLGDEIVVCVKHVDEVSPHPRVMLVTEPVG